MLDECNRTWGAGVETRKRRNDYVVRFLIGLSSGDFVRYLACMPTDSEIVEKIIRARVTEKVMRQVSDRCVVPPEIEASHRKTILSALETAGWAPFHYPRNCDGLAEPWRATVLWSAQARQVAAYMEDELGVTSKEPKLAAACGALVLVTWIPETPKEDCSESVQASCVARNEEHLAASSAMVQNLLLLLTANGFGNYWSSGGRLRSAEVAEYLGVPSEEKLLAAVFVEYPDLLDDDGRTLRKPGAHRDKRSGDWIREANLS